MKYTLASVRFLCRKALLYNTCSQLLVSGWNLLCRLLFVCPYWQSLHKFDQRETFQRGFGHRSAPKIHQNSEIHRPLDGSPRGVSSQISMQVNSGHNLCCHMQNTMVSFVQWQIRVAPNCLPLDALTIFSKMSTRSMYDIQKLDSFPLLLRNYCCVDSPGTYRRLWKNSGRLGLSKTFCCSFWDGLSYKSFSPSKKSWTNCFLAGNVSSTHAWNPFQISLWSASYINLWNLTARLYLRSSRTPVTEPSAITPDSMQMSLKPASWNLNYWEKGTDCMKDAHSWKNICKLVWVFPSYLCRLGIQSLIKYQYYTLQSKSFFYLQGTDQNLMNGWQAGGRSINGGEISDLVLTDIDFVAHQPVHPLTFRLICPRRRTKIHKRFFLRAFSSWQVTSTDVLGLGPWRLPAL